ncbi:MAG: redoxin domain-containing protein, partial [Lysobacteraceae bacterium]
MTATGDYRFLEGQLAGNLLQLSTFDGGFLYLFEATVQKDGSLKGEFWSGKTGYQTWEARKDANASLKDPTKITTLQPGTETISFTFPDLEGKKVSLSDDQFRNKVVIIQILGSWCPNCLDETAFLAPWY